MGTLITKEKRIEDITLDNIKNGEVTLIQLNEIYKKMGFVFVADSGVAIPITPIFLPAFS